jgi:hypothetical protein
MCVFGVLSEGPGTITRRAVRCRGAAGQYVAAGSIEQLLMPPEPLNYAPPPAESRTARHNRIYTVLLIALAFFYVLGMISILSISRSPAMRPESRWTLQMVVWIYTALIAAMVATLILRGVAPRAGRIATMSLNIILLILFPFGTALGIYGLWKVDKGGQAGGA